VARTVPITIRGDALDEPDEYVLLAFSEPANAGIGGLFGLGVVAILDDDPVAVVAPGLATVTEGDAGTKTLAIPVTLSAPSGRTVTAQWTTVPTNPGPGLATAPDDYEAGAGTVTFAPGRTTATVAVTVRGDTIDEVDEFVLLAFSNPINAKVGGFSGLGFGGIVDDDPA
jgi:hypothetical protein